MLFEHQFYLIWYDWVFEAIGTSVFPAARCPCVVFVIYNPLFTVIFLKTDISLLKASNWLQLSLWCFVHVCINVQQFCSLPDWVGKKKIFFWWKVSQWIKKKLRASALGWGLLSRKFKIQWLPLQCLGMLQLGPLSWMGLQKEMHEHFAPDVFTVHRITLHAATRGFFVPKRTAYWEFDVICSTINEKLGIQQPSCLRFVWGVGNWVLQNIFLHVVTVLALALRCFVEYFRGQCWYC